MTASGTLFGPRGDATKYRRSGIWTKTLKRFVHGFKVVAQDERTAKMNRVVILVANSSHLGVVEGDPMRCCWNWNRNAWLKKRQDGRKLQEKKTQEHSQ